MKKLLVLVCLALAFTACFGSVSALAAEEPAAEPQNLLNFEAADFGKNFYDSSLGEVMLYGDDTRVYIPTCLDYIKDGNIQFADGTSVPMNEVTFVMEATISQAVMATWTVPFLVFAKNGIDTYEYHMRANIVSTSTSYFFQRADEVGNYTENILQEIPVPVTIPAGGAYTVRITYCGTKVSVEVVVDGEVVAQAQDLDILPETYTPVFSFGDRTNGESVISDMKYYIQGGELANYASGLVVETPPENVEYGADLTGGTFKIMYIDGTSETKSLEDFTVTGFDKNVVGEQTVTVSTDVLNQTLTASFTVTVNDKETIAVSVNKTEYAYGEEFDLSSIEVVKKFASGKADEKVATTSADFAISGYDANTSGEQTVTITYAGQTYTVKVTVAEKQGCGSAISPVGGIAIGATVLVAALAAVLIKRKSCR